ncbi:YigZ family protein [Sanguibacter sp. 25GB23B1]|uniref:IMPACT family protein n=1 Tax=unclassified Sanguibacter TaxID=2645534 RepID=UPI0032AF3182
MSAVTGSADTGPELPSTIEGDTTSEIVVKRSRFITRLAHVPSVEAADAVVATVRRDRWDARHHCVALVVGPRSDVTRSSDDGEPSGTAGAPMSEVLRRHGLTDVVAVVSRYFGGVLLGTGGLARAYSGAVDGAVEGAQVVRRREVDRVVVRVPHEAAGRVEHFLRDRSAAHGALVVGVTWTSETVLEMLVPPARRRRLESDLADFSAGALLLETVGREIADIPPS